METENINTKAGSDISAFDDSTKWNDSFSVETSDKSVDVDISADITLPDCKSMSVVEVKNIKVGADFKKSVIEAYFGDSTVYYHDIPHYTKEEIYHSMEVVKNAIAGYQQEIDAGLTTEEGVSRVMKIENDPYLKQVVDNADMVLVDGKPLVWISKLHGKPLKAKISGSDLVPLLCEVAAQKNYTIFIIGGKEGIAEQARKRLEEKLPEIHIVGTYAPPLGFENDEKELDKINQMIVVDFIIANEDRHLNNFGLVRNANTLEWIGVAPIFDSGSSLGYDKVTPNMDKQSLIVCKPFKKTHFEQLRLVTCFDWIDFDALNNIDNEILGILNDADVNLIDDARKQKIISSINQRIEYIHNLALEKTWQINDDIAEDVENDIAEDYSSFDMSM